jgi:hypothetical protein
MKGVGIENDMYLFKEIQKVQQNNFQEKDI